MNRRDLFVFFEKQIQDFVELLIKLVSRTSQSGDQKNLNGFGDLVVNLFSEFDPRIKRISTRWGDILDLTLFPEHKDFLVLLAHMDTVKVGPKPEPVKADKNFLYGNGCYDMKNGIALFYYALKALQEFRPKINKKIKLIFTPDEESGSRQSMPFLLDKCKRARAVILPEPCCPDGGVKLQRKGVALIKARFSGKTSHSGIEPEKGRDANRALVGFILQTEKILQKFPGISFNPGIISGGYQANQVSGESCLRGEIRGFSNAQLHQVINELKKIKTIDGITVHSEINLIHPAMEKTPDNENLYHLAKKIAGSIGFELPSCRSGGSSDGSNLTDAGIPVLDGLGMRGGGAHSSGEHIQISDFPFRATLINLLCQEI